MYYPNQIEEEICYEPDHVAKIVDEICTNFPVYFNKYIETDAGHSPDTQQLTELATRLGGKLSSRKKHVDGNATLKRLLVEARDSFIKYRPKYLEILDLQALEEYDDDPDNFKNTVLRNRCPIVRSTLQNKAATELDKYRRAFKDAKPKELLEATKNIVVFAAKYSSQFFKSTMFGGVQTVDDLGLSELIDPKYTVFGVIGGGIRSLFLHMLYPEMFPSRSREAVWALWYLSGKKTFGCKEDSEFLMIDRKQTITQQNYFYPYDLFAFYAYSLEKMLTEAAVKHSVTIPPEDRFKMLDSFLSFVAQHHDEEISELKRKIDDDGQGY